MDVTKPELEDLRAMLGNAIEHLAGYRNETAEQQIRDAYALLQSILATNAKPNDRPIIAAIGAALKQAKGNPAGGYSSVTPEQAQQRVYGIQQAARSIAYALRDTDSHFDFDKFVIACGFEA